ncbi:hypothetical protein [Cupriavidus campinensis]|uniref:Uncharacterized protein n=1 Tax=Cupriavidus campinensis TaxID=151783 RepID=A0ABY3EE50_9BURK|nr:hypothetical protein [Cupriavidus campinensis]TSP09185.1 hypothetical protein FGG12_29005 [Cupriavidus campinensis]
MSTAAFQEGDKSTAICPKCKKVVSTTFFLRNAPFSDNKGSAQNILVAVCDVCGTIAGIPARSTEVIRKARR